MGALVSKEHLAKVTGYIDLAKQEGGTIVCGQDVDPPVELPAKNKAVMSNKSFFFFSNFSVLLNKGYYMLPTVITNVLDSGRCMQEEIFGKVCVAVVCLAIPQLNNS